MPRTITLDEEMKITAYLDLPLGPFDQFGLRVPGLDQTLSDFKRQRNVLAFLLMLDAGLRVGEVCRLTMPVCYFGNKPVNMLCLPAHICKGKHPREIPICERLYSALGRYNAQPLLLPDWPLTQAVICRKPQGRAVTTRSLERIICKASLGAIGRAITPHVLRHTFATKLMRKTDMRTVQELLGHKNLSSTQVYTHVNDTDKRNAINGLNSV